MNYKCIPEELRKNPRTYQTEKRNVQRHEADKRKVPLGKQQIVLCGWSREYSGNESRNKDG